MAQYVARRLVQAVGMMFLLSIIFFALVNLAPGGPLAGYGQARHIPPERIASSNASWAWISPCRSSTWSGWSGNDWMKVDTNGDGIPDSSRHTPGHFARRFWLFVPHPQTGAG